MKYRILALLVLLALAWYNLDPGAMVAYLQPALAVSIAAAQPALMISLLAVGARLAILLRQPFRRVPTVASAALLSQALNLVIPARLSELLKVSYLHAQLGIPPARTFAGIFIERLLDLALLGFMALASLSMLDNQWATLLSLGLLAAAITAAGVFLRRAPVIAAWMQSYGWVRLAHGVKRLQVELRSMIGGRTVISALALGAVAWGFSFLSVYAYLEAALGPTATPTLALWVLVMSSVGGSIPALPGGFGAYEAAAVFVLTRHGVSFEQALVTSIGLHISQYVLSGVFAVVLLMTRRTGTRQLLRELLRK